MKTCCEGGGSSRGPRWRGGLIALGLVLVAAPFCHGDAVPPPHGESRATPDEPSERVAPDGVRSRAAAAAAQSLPERDDATSGMVRSLLVHDAAGRPVPGARVTVHDVARPFGNRLVAVSDTNGVAALRLPIDAAAATSCNVEASIPGRTVTRPLLPVTGAGESVVDVGDVGDLCVRALGATLEADVWLHDRGGAAFGIHMLRADVDGEPSWRTAVAVGGQFQVTARDGAFTAKANAFGPRRQGDVVHATVDLRRCAVRGWIVGIEPGSETTGSAPDGVAFAVGKDGSFAVEVLRNAAATLTIANDVQFVAREVPAIDAEDYDVGVVAMAARPLLGTIDLRDDRGVFCRFAPRLIRVVGEGGASREIPVAGSGSVSLLSWSKAVGLPFSEQRIEILGSPGVTQATVGFRERGLFFEPRAVTVSGAAAFRVDCMRAARLVVHVDGTSGLGLVRLRLQDERGSDPIAARDARVDATGQHHEFHEVRPGRYTIFGTDVEVAGAFVELGSGADREVRVTVRARSTR
ncbi:MAG: carboxypeptidase regulatory-like domain-containing protein [Planctomycetes bacterium]|nr:carboxypeptidase regulatory-like domain-containing protein [Planctomycetota bacterium]